jgi:ribosome-associated heat shock protein Hsp15
MARATGFEQLLPDAAPPLRLDKFLWYARLLKSRTEAARLCESRHLRIDGRVIGKAHAAVRVGSVISFPRHGSVIIVRVLALPPRRGTPATKACLFQDLSRTDKVAISLSDRDPDSHPPGGAFA